MLIPNKLIRDATRLIFVCLVTLLGTTVCSSSSIPAGDRLDITDDYGLIYYSQRNNLHTSSMGGFGGIYFANLSTGEEKLLTNNSVVSQFETFSWSPITRKLVYTERGEDIVDESSLELFLLNLDGQKMRLTNNQVHDSNGRWAPNGQRIAFWSTRRIDESFLYLMNPDGSDVMPVFDHSYKQIVAPEFTWSPDSNRLAIATVNSTTLMAENIQIINLNSLETLPLLPNNRVRTNFQWSNNSNKLVYLSDPKENDIFEIYTTMYVYDVETRKEDLLAEFKAIGTPVWSPTEDVIAFSAAQASSEIDDLNIYLINGDGTGLTQLTENGAYRVASWSPDGQMLAVEAIGEQFTDHEIYIFDIDSKDLKQVTDNDYFDAFPIWVDL